MAENTPVYDVVIPARNEQEYIVDTINAIRSQTIPPNQIIVVNDGSEDDTPIIAVKLADKVVHREDRGYSIIGQPNKFGEIFNDGLKQVSSKAEYVFIIGADDYIEPDHVEQLIIVMRGNPKLVIASGRLPKDSKKGHPLGTRLVKTDWWRKLNGLKYPETWGYEDYIIFKALQQGYEAKRISYVIVHARRKQSMVREPESFGKSMYALGYDAKYAIGRCVKQAIVNGPIIGIKMLWGYINHKNVPQLDIAPWIRQHQSKQFWGRVLRLGGR